jgi:ribose transport system ATP-binding protein
VEPAGPAPQRATPVTDAPGRPEAVRGNIADATVLVSLREVWRRFPGVVALKGVSLDVRAGEVHALLGENGAGKSTLTAVASGTISPDSGTIEIGGEVIDNLTPALAQRHGLAIVHQHPALLPDMTVAENMALAAPPGFRPTTQWMREQLARVGSEVSPSARLEELSVAQRHLLELAKALASEPQVLILDEPTAPLGADMVAALFQQVRAAAARGTGVIYISHRLAEVREIADRVTVMRDGAIRGSAPIDEMSDDEMLRLIVGRAVEATFPDKHTGATANGGLVVSELSNHAFHDVHLRVAPGEIVGLAGIAGNGQAEFLRALAGLETATGNVRLGGGELALKRPHQAKQAGVAYLPADRHGEGLLMSLSVRENAALSSLQQFAHRAVIRRRAEVAAVEREREQLQIRTASIETDIEALSGGNQQKVVLARALLSNPKLLLADEPTQGVDAGARVEIYKILREVAESGVPVLIASSDGLELEGLCDRVVVFSRGHVVGELEGDDVSEEQIARTIVTATTHRHDGRAGRATVVSRRLERAGRFLRGDYLPSLVLAAVIVLLGIYTYSHNARFTAAFNMTSLMTLLAALAFISFGQLIVIMTAGIDISVGPLAGLVAVEASFFIVNGKSTSVMVLGFAIMFATAIVTGLVNGTMVRLGRFTAVAATLVSYIALQGISELLRPFQGGLIDSGIIADVTKTVGTIPIAFIVAVGLAIVLEYCLRRTRWGLAVRAAGSREQAAHRLGVRVDRTIVGAYVACSALTFLGGVMLMAQIGVGDPTQGVTYTLASITAVVLGGASLFGGRGSFIGTLLGAALLQETINATTFLNLSQAWQFWFQGIFVLVAASVYTLARRRGRV